MPDTTERGLVLTLKDRFLHTVLLICLVYLGLELAYVSRLPLVMDEFQGAWSVAQLGNGLPYRDFQPYKTVLGYYIQLPALGLGSYPWLGLLAVKLQMAIVSAIAIAFAALSLARHFRKEAVGLALAMLAVMSTFLERSPELRLDMLTGWAGLASLLLLLDRRVFRAGVLAGFGFLVSQKGAYYILAGEAAIVAVWLFESEARDSVRRAAHFAGGVLAVLGPYLLAWSLVSSPGSVLHTVFLAPGAVALGDLYEIRRLYWAQTVLRNPLFYALGSLGLVLMVRLARSGTDRYRGALLFGYGVALLALCVWHRQPWPYFFLLLIPTVFVLITAFFDAGLRWSAPGRRLGMTAPMMATYVALGIAYPLMRVPVNLARSHTFQREMVELANSILADGDTYLAGLHLLRDQSQSVGSLRWVDGPARVRLHRASTAQLSAILDSLERMPPKLVIDNYRMRALPPPLRSFIETNYATLWGNVLIYAPGADDPDGELAIDFSGDYLVTSPDRSVVSIDGRTVTSGGRVRLSEGLHRYESTAPFRLRLEPEGWRELADPDSREPRDFFPDVYTY